jgi:LPXTG-motif cell wall-anchored protein
VNFTDGTSAIIPLQFSDWTKGGNQGATPLYGNIEVVKSSYRLVGANPSPTASYFFSTVPYVIPQGRTVSTITMPMQPGEPGVEGRVHVFAIASDGVRADLGFTATAGDDITSVVGSELTAELATVTMADDSAPTPQARVQWGDDSDTEDAAVTVDDDGTLVLGGTHTYEAPGTYTVSVTVANGSGTTQLSLTAVVTAPPVYATTLTVGPADGVLAGADITVAGDGFAAGETVELELQTAPAVTATVTADGGGAFSTSMTVPDGTPPGLVAVVATGATSAMPATATVKVVPVPTSPVYSPSVRATAESGRPGDIVTLSITGFAPDEEITVVFNSAPVLLGTPRVDRRGALDFSFRVPAGVDVGDHTITLDGSASGASTALAFRVLPAALPGDGSTSGRGPTDPSAVNRLGSTGFDARPAAAIGALALLAGLALLLVRRRRRGAATDGVPQQTGE